MNSQRFLKEEIEKGKNFGLPLVLFDLLARATKSAAFYRKKHDVVLNYLKKNYQDVLQKYKTQSSSDGNIESDCPIWVFWYQGFEEAPILVQRCLQSLKKCAGNHPIYEVSKYNYYDYVEIPTYIQKKVETKKITITQFSDVLRVSLLAKYGGCWADATIFFVDWIRDNLDELSWFSVKQKPKFMNPKYVSEYRWATYFHICARDNIIEKYMRDMYYAYWKEQSSLIDYFLQDYFLALGYSLIPEIAKQVDNIPYNNQDVDWLRLNLNQKYEEAVYEQITKNTALFKLDWREKAEFAKDTYGEKLINEEYT